MSIGNNWSWSFGDGGSASTRLISHAYTAFGRYTVTETVYATGGSDSASTTITTDLSPPSGTIVINGDATNTASTSVTLTLSATDKQALIEGQTAACTNYTSYSKGINGIMVDIAGLANSASLGAADFAFKVGNDSTPSGSGWSAGPTPRSVTVRTGAGAGGPYSCRRASIGSMAAARIAG